MHPLTSATGLEPNDILRFILDDPYGQAEAGDEVTVREVRNGFIVLKESRVDGYHPSKFAWVRRPGSALQETDRRNEIFQLKMDGLRDQMNALQAFRRVLTEHRIERASGVVEMLRAEDVEAMMEKLAGALSHAAARAEAQDEGAAGKPVTLAECPPGLFLWNGTLGFKSEYGAMEPVDLGKTWTIGNGPDAYCADSGEYFWGGTSNHADRAKVLVMPIDAVSAHPSPTPAADEDRVRIPTKWMEVAEYATERGLAVHESNMRLEEFRRVVTPEALAALKSTAAKE